MSTPTFAPATLPDSVKESMCRGLLEEFGATITSVREPDGELIHRCALPWHEERRPSASLNYKKLTYRCLSCDSKGGLLWFIAACRDVPGPEAKKWLEGQTGLGVEFDLGALLNLIDAIDKAPTAQVRPPMPKFSPLVLKPWKVIHEYLTEDRGVPEQNIVDLSVGYAERYKVSDMQRSQRIVIPHFWRGDLVGWQSRRIYKDGTPKYLSTSDFPRDRTLYNHQPNREMAVVVESPMSVLRHYHHIPFEATFGAAVTDQQVKLLARHRRVVIWMDNDPAGWRATEGAWEEFGRRRKKVSAGLIERLAPYTDVRVVNNPWAADPGDMDDQTVEELVATAVPYPLWRRPRRLREWEVK